jgi:hypothetical protein
MQAPWPIEHVRREYLYQPNQVPGMVDGGAALAGTGGGQELRGGDEGQDAGVRGQAGPEAATGATPQVIRPRPFRPAGQHVQQGQHMQVQNQHDFANGCMAQTAGNGHVFAGAIGGPLSASVGIEGAMVAHMPTQHMPAALFNAAHTPSFFEALPTSNAYHAAHTNGHSGAQFANGLVLSAPLWAGLDAGAGRCEGATSMSLAAMPVMVSHHMTKPATSMASTSNYHDNRLAGVSMIQGAHMQAAASMMQVAHPARRALRMDGVYSFTGGDMRAGETVGLEEGHLLNINAIRGKLMRSDAFGGFADMANLARCMPLPPPLLGRKRKARSKGRATARLQEASSASHAAASAAAPSVPPQDKVATSGASERHSGTGAGAELLAHATSAKDTPSDKPATACATLEPAAAGAAGAGAGAGAGEGATADTSAAGERYPLHLVVTTRSSVVPRSPLTSSHCRDPGMHLCEHRSS